MLWTNTFKGVTLSFMVPGDIKYALDAMFAKVPVGKNIREDVVVVCLVVNQEACSLLVSSKKSRFSLCLPLLLHYCRGTARRPTG